MLEGFQAAVLFLHECMDDLALSRSNNYCQMYNRNSLEFV